MSSSKSTLRTILEPLGVALILGLLVRMVLHLYAIPSDSMAPLLVAGDQIVVTRYVGEPERGDVLVFVSPINPDELMVKRVIAVPGDLVESRLGRMRIGGYTIPEPYLLRQSSSGAVAAQLIPRDSYFVMGDNRDDSNDSRSWGVIHRQRVVGRARVAFSLPHVQAATSPPQGTEGGRRSPAAPFPFKSRSSLFKWIE